MINNQNLSLLYRLTQADMDRINELFVRFLLHNSFSQFYSEIQAFLVPEFYQMQIDVPFAS